MDHFSKFLPAPYTGTFRGNVPYTGKFRGHCLLVSLPGKALCLFLPQANAYPSCKTLLKCPLHWEASPGHPQNPFLAPLAAPFPTMAFSGLLPQARTTVKPHVLYFPLLRFSIYKIYNFYKLFIIFNIFIKI